MWEKVENHWSVDSKEFCFWWIIVEMMKTSCCDNVIFDDFVVLKSLFNGRAHNDDLQDTLDTEKNTQLSTNI